MSFPVNRFAFDNLVPGNPAAPYGADLKPIIQADGTPLIAPWTHIARRNYLDLQKSGLFSTGATRDSITVANSGHALQRLGADVLLTASTDVVVVTIDGYALLAQRSNRGAAAGECIHTAGGATAVIDGKPESIVDCARRELKEETNLVVEDIKLIGTGPVSARLAVVDLKTTDEGIVQGVVAYASHQMVAKSSRTLEELAQDVSLNAEHVGMVAINVGQLNRLAVGQFERSAKGKIVSLSYFHSSSDFAGRTVTPLLEKQLITGLDQLRGAVLEASPMTSDERAQRGYLTQTSVIARSRDFAYFNNSLAVVSAAFMEAGFRPNAATRRFAAINRMPVLRTAAQAALSPSLPHMPSVNSARFNV